jgi:hypothetical protein
VDNYVSICKAADEDYLLIEQGYKCLQNANNCRYIRKFLPEAKRYLEAITDLTKVVQGKLNAPKVMDGSDS